MAPVRQGHHDLTYDGYNTLTYYVENRMVQAENAMWCGSTNPCTYLYDPLGERKQKTVAGAATDFVLAGGEEIADYYEASATWRLTVRGAGGLPLAAVIPAGGDGGEAIVYVHHDVKGSTVALTVPGSSGPADTYTYSDYGQPQSGSWSMYQYAGYRYDSETGLNYVNARYYSPNLGRFLQPDPIGFSGGMNLYAYTGNDPVNLVDPTGLTPDGSQTYTITLSEAVPSFFGLPSLTVSASATFQVQNGQAQQQGQSNASSCSGSSCGNNSKARWLLAGKATLNTLIGVGKVGGGLALTAGTDGFGAAVGVYAIGSSAGNFGAAASQFWGAISGNIQTSEQLATTATTVTTASGIVTFAVTGNMQTASTAANIEGVITTPATAGFTGELPSWYDWADLGQNINDLATQ